VPTLVFTAQAFLLQSGLNKDVSQAGRIIALAFGLAFALAGFVTWAAHARSSLAYERVHNAAFGHRVDGEQFVVWGDQAHGPQDFAYEALRFVGRAAGAWWFVALLAAVLGDLALIFITAIEPQWLVPD
jgi:hypothetical protein